MDGGTSATSTTLADADRLVMNDNGTMKQVALTDLQTYFSRGIKVKLNADLSIANDTLTVLGDSNGSWTEDYDVGTIHDGSTNPDRFTFGATGKYLVTVTQEWDADSAGYRELGVYLTPNGGSEAALVLDRINTPTLEVKAISSCSTVVNVTHTGDYVRVKAKQTSGAALNLSGGDLFETSVTIARLGA